MSDKKGGPGVKTEFEAALIGTESGSLSSKFFKLEALSDKSMLKGDDLFPYRITFLRHVNDVFAIYLAPSIEGHKRLGGRAECGFNAICTADPEKAGSFAQIDPCHAVVYDRNGNARSIYFSIEDALLEEAPITRHHFRVLADAGEILKEPRFVGARWIALDAINPDPEFKDPSLTPDKIPQRDSRWFGLRKECKSYELLGGKFSGSRVWKILTGRMKEDEEKQAESEAKIKEATEKGKLEEVEKLEKAAEAERRRKTIAMRAGRIGEPEIDLAYLMAIGDRNIAIKECGAYLHPTLEDGMASPDGILVEPGVTYDSIPKQIKELWIEAGIVLPEDSKEILDSMVKECTFEAKYMLKPSKSRVMGPNPTIDTGYICQMYWEMICAGKTRAKLVRYCKETGVMRVFALYRQPVIAERLTNCMVRIRRDLLNGNSYEDAVNHPDTAAVIKDFENLSQYYNEGDVREATYKNWAATNGKFWKRGVPPPKPLTPEEKVKFAKRYKEYTLTQKQKEVLEEFEHRIRSYDFRAYNTDIPKHTIKEMNMRSETGRDRQEAVQQLIKTREEQESSLKSFKAKKGRVAKVMPDPNDRLPDATPASKRMRPPSLIPHEADIMWKDIVFTTNKMSKCIKDGNWPVLIDEQVLEEQIAAYNAFHAYLKGQIPEGEELADDARLLQEREDEQEEEILEEVKKETKKKQKSN